MAREQYSDPSGIAIIAIEQAVDDIEVAVDEIEVIVSEIQDTDLANLEENVFSPFSYKEFNYDYFNGSTPSGSWVTLFNLTGEGYVQLALACTNAGSTAMKMKITIDGNVVFNVSGTNGNFVNNLMGLLKNESILRDSLAYHMFFSDGIIAVNGKINGLFTGTLDNSNEVSYTNYRPVMALNDKVEFKTAFKVEVYLDNSQVVYGTLTGGAK